MTKKRHGRAVPPAPDAWREWAGWVPSLASLDPPPAVTEPAPATEGAFTRDQVQQIINWLFRSGYLRFSTDGDIVLGPLAHQQSITKLKGVIPTLRTIQEAGGSILLLDDAELHQAIEVLQEHGARFKAWIRRQRDEAARRN